MNPIFLFALSLPKRNYFYHYMYRRLFRVYAWVSRIPRRIKDTMIEAEFGRVPIFVFVIIFLGCALFTIGLCAAVSMLIHH